jgi:flavin-dependent dehydrogenase
MAYLGRHAVVIGASMGGLLAARALADHYETVTVVDRDTVADAREPRKGVPQGRHAHGLLARGRQVLEQLFPGLGEELIGEGALNGDVVGDVLWFNHGVYLHSAESGLVGLLISRPLLEAGVRRRVSQLPGLRIREECNVVEPVFDRERRRVTGIEVRPVNGEAGSETIVADLVVDAGGRGSRSPHWLAEFGYVPPREESIRVDIGYMTRHYRRHPEQLNGKRAVIIAACRPDWRTGVALAQENGRWILTLGGYFDDHPPSDEAAFT